MEAADREIKGQRRCRGHVLHLLKRNGSAPESLLGTVSYVDVIREG